MAVDVVDVAARSVRPAAIFLSLSHGSELRASASLPLLSRGHTLLRQHVHAGADVKCVRRPPLWAAPEPASVAVCHQGGESADCASSLDGLL
eukprot:7050813-Heterocapsa_arctica.AAC.1